MVKPDPASAVPVSATDAVEQERLRIGHEIHDRILPLLFAAQAGLTRAIDVAADDRQDNRERLEQVAKWLDDAMHTGRRLLTDIYPPELAATTWERAAADSLGRLFETLPTMTWDVQGDACRDDPAIGLTCYRVSIEACRNAITHGLAKNISVVCRCGCQDNQAHLELAITDDGSGFDPSEKREGHFGITAMRSRAEMVGGRLEVTSTCGGPTKVVLRIPAT